MSVAVRVFVALALVSSTLLTGCSGTPGAVPSPTSAHAPTAESPVATPPASDAPPPPDGPVPEETSATGGTPLAGDSRSSRAPRSPHDDTAPAPAPAPATTVDVEPGTVSGTVWPPALFSLTITPEGLGPLRLGVPVPDRGAPSAMVTWDPEYCKEFPHPQGGSTGAFHANYPKAMSPALGSSRPFTIATAHGDAGGDVASVIVFTPEVRTASGIGVGTSRTELLATYGEFDEQRAGPLSDVYVLDGEMGRLLFEVARKPSAPLADYWSDDVLDTVLWMLVLPVDYPASAIAASDASGPCSI